MALLPEDRAIKMITEGHFLTLATSSGQEVWCAPVAYVVGPGPYLHFYSATESRHAQHVAVNPNVAVSIYDSSARGEDIDGLQFSAFCAAVEGADLDVVSEHYFTRVFPDSEEREWWYRPASSFIGEGLWRFFRLDFREIFVIDTDTFEQTKIDRRTAVEPERVTHKLQAAAQA